MTTSETTTPAPTMTAEAFAERATAIETEVGRVIVGQRDLVRQTLTCLLANGHALLEGVPGLGKTLLVRTLADVIDCTFNRIQFTPDLMPADIIGTNILVEDGRVARSSASSRARSSPTSSWPTRSTGPRPRPSRRCSRRCRSTRSRWPDSATRSTRRSSSWRPRTRSRWKGPIRCPEAQLDRFFFKVLVPFPSEADLISIVDRTTGAETQTARQVTTAAEVVEMQRLARSVPIAPHVTAFAVSILSATHPDQPRAPQIVREYVRYGGSPRGAQALVTAGKIFALLDGRSNVSVDDIREAAMPALRHRLILNFEGEAEGITPEAVVRTILDAVQPASVE